MKAALKRLLFKVPSAYTTYYRLRHTPIFTGWGMTTDSVPPWQIHPDALARDFLAAHDELTSRVQSGQFTLANMTTATDKAAWLRDLMWRHYLVFWSVRHAKPGSLVECGTCDGVTAWFALKAGSPCTAYLYDAWAPMTASNLLPSERAEVGLYATLTLEQARRNLQPFTESIAYAQGVIPASFTTLPASVNWLHIDLNSSQPTTAALEAFYPRMPAGSVILFDDYGWPRYRDTKIAVDRFLADKGGRLLPFPTGQAVWFKGADQAV